MSSTNKVLEAIKAKREAEAARKTVFVKTIKPEDGKHFYRFLPSWRVEADGSRSGQFWHDYGMHWVRSNPSDKPAAYICMKDTFEEPCDICSAVYATVRAAKNDDEVKFYEGMRSTRRHLVNVLHLSGPENMRNTPQLMELPHKAFETLMDMFEEYGDITSLGADGRNIVITRSGTGLSTRYDVMPAAKTHVVDPKVLKDLINIDDVVKQKDEAKKKLVLDKLAIAVGVLPGSSAGALSAPKPASRVLEMDDDDDDVGFSATKAVEDASDDDLNELLKDLG